MMTVLPGRAFCLVLVLIASVRAYTSRITLCLCEDESGAVCSPVVGILHRGDFVVNIAGDVDTDVRIPLDVISIFPITHCNDRRTVVNRRFIIAHVIEIRVCKSALVLVTAVGGGVIPDDCKVENTAVGGDSVGRDGVNRRFIIPHVLDVHVDKGGIGVDTAAGGVSVGKDGVHANVAGIKAGVGPDGVNAGVDVDLGPIGHVKGDVDVDGHGVSGNVDTAVHIPGVIDANGKLDVDKNGDVSGNVGGKVNIDGVEVGANVGVDKGGHVSGGGSLGVGLGPLGGVDVHVQGGPGGVSTGVGAHIDAGPLHGSAGVDVNNHGKVNASAGASLGLGPINVGGSVGVDSSGHVSGGAGGSIGVGPASVQGGVSLGSNGQVSGGASGSITGPGGIGVNGNVQVGTGGASGGVSGSIGGVNINIGGGSGGGSSGGAPVDTPYAGFGGNQQQPNVFNPGQMMANLPKGGQSGTFFNPATYYQQGK